MSSRLSSETVEFEPLHNDLAAPLDVEPQSPEPSRKRGLLVKALLILLVAGGVGFAAWKIHQNTAGQDTAGTSKKSSRDKSKSVPVTVATVQHANMPIYLTALGTVTPYYSVAVRSRVDGQLMTVNAKEGQHVRKGQLLAELDPRPFEAVLEQAQGQLAKDQAVAEYAKAEASRYSELFKAGVVSQASQQLQTSTAGQSAGALLMDKGAVQSAKLNLSYTRITSPIDGVVGLRQVDPGNMVHASDANGLLLLTQLRPVTVVFIVPEDQLPEVRKRMKQKAALAVEAYDRSEAIHLASGKLLTLDNQIDTNTGTDKAKAIFQNEDEALFPNQFVNVRLILRQQEDAIVIPSSALQTGSQGTYVFVAKQGEPPAHSGGHHHGSSHAAAEPTASPSNTEEAHSSKKSKSGSQGDKGASYYAELRPITVDMVEGNQVIVKSGLAAGEQVVVDGTERLQDGSKIAPAKSHSSKDKSGHNAESDGDVSASQGSSTGKSHHHHTDQP